MKPHKHAELIKAWADGATIQYKYKKNDDDWLDDDDPEWWRDDFEFRIKPESNPDVVRLNAYELADKLSDLYKYSINDVCNEAATMLRQQADQIAELEKQDKPVAWSCWNEDMVDLPAIILFTEPDKYEWQSIKPLYRHSPQTKPLSDEEIQNIWYQHEKWLATVPLSFARAIEERHGIK